MSYIVGPGTIFSVDDGVSNAFVAIGGIKTIDPAKPEMKETEATVLSDTAERFLPTILSPGKWSFSGDMDTTQFARLFALRSTTHNYRITFVDGHTYTVSSLLLVVAPEQVDDKTVMMKCELRALADAVYV